MRFVFCLSSLAVVLVAFAASAPAQSTISINFSYNGNVDEETSHAPILATDVVGVVPVANWNDGAGEASSLASLVDDTGAATTANADWTASASWGGTSDPAPTDPTTRMMTTWLDNGGPLDITGIPFAAYDVYIYGSSDAGNEGRNLGWSVNGNNFESVGLFTNLSANGDFYNGTLVDGSTAAADPDYLLITGLVGDLSIVDHPNANGTTRSGISGIQIIEAQTEAAIRLNIDRDTGNVSLTNNTGSPINMAGLSILSGDGALDPANWTSINGNYDEGAAGGISDDEWVELVASDNELAEATVGVGTLANSQTIDLGNAWRQFVNEEVTVEYLDATTGETVVGSVLYSGTNQQSAFLNGDYDFDGDIDADDWPTQRDNYQADLSGMTLVGGYNMGDFDLDGDNDLDDLRAFKAAFLAQPGNSLASLSGAVPEPATVVMLAMAGILLGCRKWARGAASVVTPLLALVALWLAAGPSADAASFGVSFGADNAGGGDPFLQPADVAGVVPQNNWNNAEGTGATLTDLLDNTGVATTADVTWAADESWSWNQPLATTDAKLMSGWISENSGTGEASTVSVAEIPYASYDLYIYAGHDRVDNTPQFAETSGAFPTFSITEDITPDLLNADPFVYTESVGGGAGNYVMVPGLTSSSLNIEFSNTNNDRAGFAGFQIVENTGDPTVLTLEIGINSGNGTITNETGGPISLDFYEITSDPSDSLNLAGWNPIEDNGQNGFPQGDGNGNGWEVLGGVGDDRLAEFYLNGDSTLGDDESINLGSIFNTASGVQDDIVFRYTDVNLTTRFGLIEFIDDEPPTGLAGDYNGDGAVDAADYTVWRDNLGGDASAFADGSRDPSASGPVGSDDYDFWRTNFGNTAGSLDAASATVPEPSTIISLSLATTAVLLLRRKKHGAFSMATKCFSGLVCLLLAGSLATAAVTNDRFYRMGDDGLEGTTGEGLLMGANNTPPADNNFTLDSAGSQSGTFVDLQVFEATYTAATWPGAPGGQFAANFDGVNDHLIGFRLGLPSTSISSTGSGTEPPGPLNYDGIANRGMQMWIRPDSAGNGTAQTVIGDTLQHGIEISADGTWVMQYAGSEFDSEVAVAFDAWTHVMVVRPFGSANGSRMYVDGVYVAGAPGGYTGGDDSSLVIGANPNGNDPPVDGFFDGAVDDVEMFVMGVATTAPNPDYGTFEVQNDNPILAAAVSGLVDGDLTDDDIVNDDDVAIFASNWRAVNEINGVAAGDLSSRELGDFNYDGVVNFDDWFILRGAHVDGATLNLADWLDGGSAVPEPSAVVIAVLAASGLVGLRLRRRS